ncbi:MAG: YHYH domain-containing protein, partial [Aureliella sp.]
MRAPGVFLLSLAICLTGVPTLVRAHGGGLNAEGCHNDRKRGGYHCHRGGGGSDKLARSAGERSTGGAYKNCT